MLTLPRPRDPLRAADGPPAQFWRPGGLDRLLSAALTAAFAVVAALTLGGGMLVVLTGGHGGRAGAMIPLVWGTAVVVGLIRQARHCVVSVQVDAQGTLRFRTLTRTVVVYPGALQSVSPRRADVWGIAGLLVDGGGSRLVLPRSLDRLCDLLDVARRWNPQARIADL